MRKSGLGRVRRVSRVRRSSRRTKKLKRRSRVRRLVGGAEGAPLSPTSSGTGSPPLVLPQPEAQPGPFVCAIYGQSTKQSERQ